jgi:hypothetical protein
MSTRLVKLGSRSLRTDPVLDRSSVGVDCIDVSINPRSRRKALIYSVIAVMLQTTGVWTGSTVLTCLAFACLTYAAFGRTLRLWWRYQLRIRDAQPGDNTRGDISIDSPSAANKSFTTNFRRRSRVGSCPAAIRGQSPVPITGHISCSRSH